MRKKIVAFLISMMSVLLIVAQPHITSFSPISAAPGDQVTINGSGFYTIAQSNAVFFSGVRAAVISATATQLIVNVPFGARYGAITIVDLQNQKQGTSNLNFIPSFNPNKGSTWTVNDFESVVSPAGNVGMFLEFADFNGDGKPDMLESKTTGTAGFRVRRNVSTLGTLTTSSFASAESSVNTGQTYLEALTVADYNNDGKWDIITAGSAGGTSSTLTGTLSVYINTTTTGTISFAPPVTQTYNMRNGTTCSGRVGGIKCEDLDSDGWADIVISNNQYDFNGNAASSCNSTIIGAHFKNLSNSGSAIIGSPSLISVSSYAARDNRIVQLEVADLNQDGKKDLLFGIRAKTFLFKNIASSGMLDANSFIVTTVSLLDGDRGIGVGDLNGDGLLDLALASRTGDVVRLYRNTSANGTFAFATPLSVAIGTDHATVNNQTIAIGDITGDGKPEIFSGADSPRILLNKITSSSTAWSSSSFTSLTNIGFPVNTNSEANACKIVDLDVDGKSDIVALTGATGNAVSMRRSRPIPEIFVGTLALNYCPGVQISVPYTATYSLSGGNTFTVQLSNATGSFASPVVIGTLSGTTTSGVITCTIPINTPSGTGYKIRINASSPAVTGIPNSGNIVINSNVIPSVLLEASQTLVCLNSAVTFSTVYTNTGANPTFQWYKNGIAQSAIGSSYTDNLPSNGDTYYVAMNASSGCSTNNVNSNAITLNGVNQVTPSVTITDTQSTICDFTTSVGYVATPANGGPTPTYQWKKNGVNVGTNSSVYNDTNPIQGDQVMVEMTSNASCLTSSFASSNVITLSYSGSTVVPTVSISTSQTNICAGVNQVVFNANYFNGGYSPTFQWKRNGVNVGSNSAQLTLNAPVNGDQISLVMVSNADCATPASVTSNTITLTTQSVSTPSITVSAPATNLCGSSSVIYTATVTNGGSNPFVSWYKNGTLVLQGVNSLVSNNPVSGDEVYATLVSNASCLTSTNANSNTVVINVQPVVVPTVQLVLSQGTNPKCAGDSQQLHAVVSNGGIGPTYAWYRNGNLVANQSTAFLSSNTWAVDDAIYCQVVPNNSCQSTNLLLTTEFIVDESTPTAFYLDADGDGFGDLTQEIFDCGAPQGYVDNFLDCDDAEPSSFPGNIEVCENGIDDDCLNGDDICPIAGCIDPNACNYDFTAGVDDGTCVYPQPEVCNGLDDNCDGEIDEFVTNTFYIDNDGDGFGNIDVFVLDCQLPAGYADNGDDCDDGSITYNDNDGDGYGVGAPDACGSAVEANDCDDNDSSVNPNGMEICENTIDEDCDGIDAICDILGCMDPTACNYDPSANSDDGSCLLPQPEICNDLDDDCNGFIDDGLELLSYYADFDLDGMGSGPVLGETCNFILDAGFSLFGDDCDDNEPSISPIANEVCNSVDDNCDGQVNEGLWIAAYLDGDGDGYGNDGISVDGVCELTTGLIGVGGDCDDQSSLINPDATEICNELDDNCDGFIDEGLAQELFADLDGDGFGDGSNAIFTCLQTSGFVVNADDCDDNKVTYDDLDGDGFGAGLPTACGAALNAGDCDDSDSNVLPGGIDLCSNGIDEDCSGADSLCAVLGCIDVAACNYNPQASEDDGSCIYAQLEICNGVDDNCNGQIDEGIAGQLVSAVTVTTALFPTCATGNFASANLNNGSDTPWISGSGKDLWYKLTAQYNALRVGLSAASGDNEIRLYRDFNGCVTLIATEHETTTGNQTLISDQLEAGGTYYILVHHIGGNINASAKVCFNHFTASTCDHFYSNGTGVYTSVCGSFKVSYRSNAAQYSVNVLSCTMNGLDQGITPWTYTTPTANSIVSRLGDILPSNTDAAAKVYTVKVPVVYNIPDAAGNLSSIVANDNQTCTITLNKENTIALRLSDRCPAIKSITSTIAPDRTVCGAIRYEWEFTEVLPSTGAPQVVQGGAYASAFFLSNIPGVAVGKTYSVRVRPVHSSNAVGNWGTAYCLRVGAAGMVQQSENENVFATTDSPIHRFTDSPLSLYPNPTATGSFVLQYNGPRRGEWTFAQESMMELVMMDITGKVVFKTNVVLNGNIAEIHFGDLESGLYLVDFGGERTRVQVMK